MSQPMESELKNHDFLAVDTASEIPFGARSGDQQNDTIVRYAVPGGVGSKSSHVEEDEVWEKEILRHLMYDESSPGIEASHLTSYWSKVDQEVESRTKQEAKPVSHTTEISPPPEAGPGMNKKTYPKPSLSGSMMKVDKNSTDGCSNSGSHYYVDPEDKDVRILIRDGAYVKPKRILNAYNIFFQDERRKVLLEEQQKQEQENATHGQLPAAPEESLSCGMNNKKKLGSKRSRLRSKTRIGFANLARTISARWKMINPETHKHYLNLSKLDKDRHAREMKVWRKLEAQVASQEIDPTRPNESLQRETEAIVVSQETGPAGNHIQSGATTEPQATSNTNVSMTTNSTQSVTNNKRKTCGIHESDDRNVSKSHKQCHQPCPVASSSKKQIRVKHQGETKANCAKLQASNTPQEDCTENAFVSESFVGGGPTVPSGTNAVKECSLSNESNSATVPSMVGPIPVSSMSLLMAPFLNHDGVFSAPNHVSGSFSAAQMCQRFGGGVVIPPYFLAPSSSNDFFSDGNKKEAGLHENGGKDKEEQRSSDPYPPPNQPSFHDPTLVTGTLSGTPLSSLPRPSLNDILVQAKEIVQSSLPPSSSTSGKGYTTTVTTGNNAYYRETTGVPKRNLANEATDLSTVISTEPTTCFIDPVIPSGSSTTAKNQPGNEVAGSSHPRTTKDNNNNNKMSNSEQQYYADNIGTSFVNQPAEMARKHPEDNNVLPSPSSLLPPAMRNCHDDTTAATMMMPLPPANPRTTLQREDSLVDQTSSAASKQRPMSAVERQRLAYECLSDSLGEECSNLFLELFLQPEQQQQH